MSQLERPKVAFVCSHNSCRSQIAEALGKLYASDVLVALSAGTNPARSINPDAVRIIKTLYGVDMEASQRPKALADLPKVDIVVTMGCSVQCPLLPCQHREDWQLEDPTGKPDEDFYQTIRQIEQNLRGLMRRIQNDDWV